MKPGCVCGGGEFPEVVCFMIWEQILVLHEKTEIQNPTGCTQALGRTKNCSLDASPRINME